MRSNPSSTIAAIALLLTLWAAALTGCATGELDEPGADPNPRPVDEEDAGPTGRDAESPDLDADPNASDPDTDVPSQPCSVQSDCTGEQICDTDAGQCVEPCQGHGDCSPLRCDAQSGRCVECVTGADCTEGICDIEGTNRCVECLGDADCGGEICHPTEQACVECVTSGDCSDGVCSDGQCVGCVDDNDCFGSTECDQSTNLCVGCANDGDCPDGYCLVTEAQCVGCINNDHCGDWFCDMATNVCRACVTDAHCPGQICHSANYCQDCEVDAHCPGTQICTNQLECVECENNSHCPTGEICGVDNTCAECHIDAHCSSGNCVGGSCTTQVSVTHPVISIDGPMEASGSLQVSGCDTIAQFEVVIDIVTGQLWRQDLLILLTSPAGAEYDISLPGNGFTSGAYVFPTIHTPPDSLSPLIGQTGNGTWGLEILYVGFDGESGDIVWTMNLVC